MATTFDKGHGRIEKRTLRTTSIPTLGPIGPGLKQGFGITRERTVGGRPKTVEVVYGMTSLSADRATAEQLLAMARDHWQIEHSRHCVRDGTLGEDARRVRAGAAPQVLAAFRNAVVHLVAEVGAKSVPEAIERLQLDPERAQRLIGLPQGE